METKRLDITLIKTYIVFYLAYFLGAVCNAQTGSIQIMLSNSETGSPVPFAVVQLEGIRPPHLTNEMGIVEFENLPYGNYTLLIKHISYSPDTIIIKLEESTIFKRWSLQPATNQLSSVELTDSTQGSSSIGWLSAIENGAIYAGKKNEVIYLNKVEGNLAANNARQIFSKVPGLNIWESDGAGIQLGIGGRGLSPNRTAHFNVRQNGYDISADALGYPESYYTPPAEALHSIQVVRGAASLQYGPQFGGMVNFNFKEGSKHNLFCFTQRNTYGSFNFLNSFSSIDGTYKKLQYYAFYQYKRSDGWRPNSGFELHTAHGGLKYTLSSKTHLKVEYTHMQYLAQQPGGLTDAMFEEDPTQSIRERNWFKVDWNVLALVFDHKFNTNTSLNSRTFGVLSGREALGVLERINVIDFGEERNLIQDRYLNFGNETRFLHRYQWFNNTNAILVGCRYYQGYTDRQQGLANDGKGPDFYLLNPEDPEGSAYIFPSRNISFFAENIFRPTKRLSIIPGVRFESIDTRSEGFYKQRVLDAAGNVIVENKIDEKRGRQRAFVLLGLGVTYQVLEKLEIYGNVSQNYRPITFNDLRIVNPNFAVDENLQDERGFNADIGARGSVKDYLSFDASLFFLYYAQKIGLLLKDDIPPLFLPYRLRTNIADAQTFGLECFAEIDLLKVSLKKTPKALNLSFFSSFTLQNGIYINTDDPAIRGRQIELVPPILFRCGLQFGIQNFQISWQSAYTHQHFTDATNATFTSNAVNGIIPSYYVMDLAASYRWKWLRLETGINNLTNNHYFTRRAEGYPGPGIIPSDGRSLYISLQWQIGVKTKE